MRLGHQLWAAWLAAALALMYGNPAPAQCSPQCTCGCNAGLPCSCGNPPPAPISPPARKAPLRNFGVEEEKVTAEPKYVLSGKEVTRKQAEDAIEKPSQPDEANKLRLVLIGTDADRKRVLDDLETSPAWQGIKSGVVVHAYPPDAPAVKSRGFVATGSPSIYLLAPGGRVIGRNIDGQYHGALPITKAIEQNSKPPYDPNKDPNLGPQPKPKSPDGKTPDEPKPPFDPKSLPWWAWGLGGGAAAYLLLGKKGAPQS